MRKDSLNPFVGLKPYSEKQSDFFYGREHEVENLLTLLQKNKLVTLTGASGSGKTSLIRAGLIKRLKNGFLGQAGKEWSIASFRPGINPLSNLAHSLTANDVLKISAKPNTTDYNYYANVITDFEANGLIEIYRNSEISRKRNLLVIIDQLEDLFKFQKHFDVNISDDDDVLMDMVYKSISNKNTSIYFLISIDSAYIAKLNNYRKLNEILSQSQYSIQNLDYNGIAKMLKENFEKHHIQFDNKVIDSFTEVLNTEISYLPNFQFLLSKIYDTFADTNSNSKIITEEIVADFGGIKNAISNEIEKIFLAESKGNRNMISLFFKSIIDPNENFNANQYEKISNICNYLDINQKQLTTIINPFKTSFLNILEIINPIISDDYILTDRNFDLNNILNFKYAKFLNWERHHTWFKEEENDYLHFKSIYEDAIKKSNKEVDFLKTPELESAILWRNNKNHNNNWARKYKFNFKETLFFINDSEVEDTRIKKEKTDQIERETKNEKTKKKWYAIGFGICLVLACIAFYFQKTAVVEADNAKNAMQNAKKSETKAKEKEIEALDFATEAEKSKKIAEESFKQSKINENIANLEKNIAKRALFRLKIAQKKDSLNQLQIKETNINLKKSKEFAESESEKNKTIKELIELKLEFRELTTKLDNAFEEDNKPVIKKLINESLSKQKRFDSLRLKKNITDYNIDGNLIDLNQKTLAILENKSKYSQTSMRLAKSNNYSIRDFSIYKNKMIAYSGDKGEIYFYDINQQKKLTNFIAISNNKIEDRIRNIIYDNSEALIATTFSGKLIKINTSTNSTTELYKSTLKDGLIIDFFIDNKNNTQYLVLENKIVKFLNFKKSAEYTNYINIQSAFLTDSILYFSTNNNLQTINSRGETSTIPLEIKAIIYKEITTINKNGNNLFIGLNSGKVIWCNLDIEKINNKKALNIIQTFDLHDSKVTCIYFDSSDSILFTSSLDNRIFRYDLKLPNNKITSSFTELIGHDKWIWQMSSYIDKNNKKLLVTSDEDGNLLTWYTEISDLKEKINSLLEDF